MTAIVLFGWMFAGCLILFMYSLIQRRENLNLLSIAGLVIAVVGMLWAASSSAQVRKDECIAVGGDEIINGQCYAIGAPIPMD